MDWLNELELKLKSINSKITRLHDKIEGDIDNLKEFYVERENIMTDILEGEKEDESQFTGVQGTG